MNYYKDTNNEIFAYDDTQTPAEGLVSITEEEKDAILLAKDNENKQTVEYKLNEAKSYLISTDFYMTVDKYATLSEERKLELTTARAEARKLINSLEESETPVVETKTNDVFAELDQATQKYIDDIITNLGYADLQEVTKYSTYSNIKQLECLKLLDFNTLCWNKSINIKKQVESGEITELTTQEFIALLPRYTA